MEDWWTTEKTESCAEKLIEIIERRSEGLLFAVMTRKDTTISAIVLRKAASDWKLYESGQSRGFSMSEAKRLKTWARQF